jgi:hypothetical protein
MQKTFSAVDQFTQTLTILGPITIGVYMAGANTLLIQQSVAGNWVTMADGTLTTSTSVTLDPGGVPIYCRIYNSVHAANATVDVVGNFLADEITVLTGGDSILMEDGDDLLVESGDYLELEAA